MKVLGEHEREAIRGVLEGLERDVPLLLELGPEEIPVTVIAGGHEIDFGAETQALLEQVARLSERVVLTVSETKARGSWPKTTVGGRLVYHGLPWGFELTTLVGAIAEAGRAASSLSEGSLAAIASLEHDVALEVYVTPTCPHCPPAVLMAYRCALARPRGSRPRPWRRRSSQPPPTVTASCQYRRSSPMAAWPGSVPFPRRSSSSVCSRLRRLEP